MQPQTFIRRDTIPLSTVNSNVQLMCFPAPLYSVFGQTNDYDDLQTISQTMIENATGQTWPTNSQFTGRFHVKGRQELELYNKSTVPIYFDIYEYYTKKVIQQPTMNAIMPTPANWPQIVSAITNTTMTVASKFWKEQSLGVDPFDFTEITHHLKITKKSKVQLAPSEGMILTKTGKGFVYDGNENSQYTANTRVADKLGKGVSTCGYLLVCCGPANTSDAEPFACTVMTTNTYVAKAIPGVVKVQTTNLLP